MTFTHSSDLAVGTPVTITDATGSCFSVGDTGVIIANEVESYGDRYFHIQRDGDEMTQYIYLSGVSAEPTDPASITDLDTFRRLIVREAMKAKAEHNWCSEAEQVLRAVGLGDLMPTWRTVTMEVTVNVLATPGQSEAGVRRAARTHVNSLASTETANHYIDAATVQPAPSTN